MTRRERPEFSDEFSEAEFFGFAKSYLSEVFPNPHRIGCPPDFNLHRMAEHPAEARDEEVSEHLTCCSPCFNRYMEILGGLKAAIKQRIAINGAVSLGLLSSGSRTHFRKL